ncbi:MAG: holin [Pseudonocardiaceae bacterium]
MFKCRFWQLTGERAVKTFAQSLVAILSATSVGLLTAPWTMALSTAGMAAVFSVLTSMASAPVGEPNTPNLLPHTPSPAPTSPAPAANTSVAAS